LAEPFDMSLPAISKHLKVLERAGLIDRRVDGRIHQCHLEARPMSEAAQWIDRYRVFWQEQFDALEHYLQRRRAAGPNRSIKRKKKEKT
jgi:DNA-binding transcriptional ArsR family regulator